MSYQKITYVTVKHGIVLTLSEHNVNIGPPIHSIPVSYDMSHVDVTVNSSQLKYVLHVHIHYITIFACRFQIDCSISCNSTLLYPSLLKDINDAEHVASIF